MCTAEVSGHIGIAVKLYLLFMSSVLFAICEKLALCDPCVTTLGVSGP